MNESGYLTATRTGYDAIAEQYAATFQDPLTESPLDRGLLAGFAELVRRDHSAPQVLEVGSGPGDVTAHLHQLGLAIRGIDLSSKMVAIASRTYPELSFEVGEMSALDVPDAALAAVVCWYSLIHIPPAMRPAVLREFCRVLRPGGYLLLAFQVGDDILHFDEAFGHEVNLDFHRLDPDTVAGLVEGTGLRMEATMVRAAERNRVAAPVPQGFVIARAQRPGPAQE